MQSPTLSLPKTVMECPICFETKPVRHKIVLECRHSLCFDCAFRWLPKECSCPTCRRTSFFFSRPTRSQTSALRLLGSLQYTLSYLEAVGATFDPNQEIDTIATLLECFIMKNKSLWYRPTHQVIVVELCNEVKEILQDDLTGCQPSTKHVLETFVRQFGHL